MKSESGLDIHFNVQYFPGVMEPLFHYGHVPVQTYIVLPSRPENKDTQSFKLGHKRKNEEDNTPESTEAKRTKLEDDTITEEESNQEDMPEPEKPSEPILPEADRVLFGRVTRLL